MHARTEWREDAQPPVADLVAEALHDDRAIGRDGARRGRLLVQERDEVPGGVLVEVMRLLESCESLRLRLRDQLPRRLTDRLAELERTADPLPLPEGHGSGDAGRRRDEHPVARDLLDAP